jgi:hypothetical protein
MIFHRLFIAGAVLVPTACGLWWQHRQARDLDAENVRLLAQVEQASRETAACRAEAKTTETLLQRCQGDLDRLEKDVTEAGHGNSAANSRLGSGLAGLAKTGDDARVSLSKTNLHRLTVKAITDDFRLTDEAAGVLGMSPAERQALDRALAQLVAKHEQLDLAKAKPSDDHLSSEPGRKTTFKVPAYPDEGKALGQDFLNAAQQTLDADRSALLAQYADLGFGSLSADGFEPFGRTEKTITFLDRYTEDGQRGDCRVLMKVVDSATGMSLVTGFPNTDDKIPLNWRHLIQNIAPVP